MNKRQLLNELKTLFWLSLPMIASQLARGMINFSNTLIIARLGTKALAAAAMVTSTFSTLTVLSWGIISALGVLIAHAFGADEQLQIGHITSQGFWLALFIALPGMMLLWQMGEIFKFFNQPLESIALAKPYLYGLMGALLPMLWYSVLQQLMLGLGRARLIMLGNCLSLVFSFGFAYSLAFGCLGLPALGLAGVGLGGSLANFGLLVFLVAGTFGSRYYRRLQLLRTVLKPNWVMMKHFLSLGGPIGLMLAIEFGALWVAVLIIGQLGQDALAAYQITMQTVMLVVMVLYGISQAVTSLMGQAIGRKQPAQAARYAYLGIGLATLYMGVIAIIFWCYPRPVLSLFLNVKAPANRLILDLAIQLLHIAALFQLADGVRIVAGAALRGLKDTRAAMYYSFLGLWLIGLPIGYTLTIPKHLGAVGMWWGLSLGLLAIMLMTMYRLRNRLKQLNCSELKQA